MSALAVGSAVALALVLLTLRAPDPSSVGAHRSREVQTDLAGRSSAIPAGGGDETPGAVPVGPREDAASRPDPNPDVALEPEAEDGEPCPADDPKPEPGTPEEVVARIRAAHAGGWGADEAGKWLDVLRRCASRDPGGLLAAIAGERHPELLDFLYRGFDSVRRPEQIATIADAMIHAAVNHPCVDHRAGSLRYLNSILWHYRDDLTAEQEAALLDCAEALDAAEPVAARTGASRLLAGYLDRPRAAAALSAYAAGASVDGDDADRGAALVALAEARHAGAFATALAVIESGSTPARQASAAEALLRLPASTWIERRGEVIETALRILAREADETRRLPALLALVVADPERAALYLSRLRAAPPGVGVGGSPAWMDRLQQLAATAAAGGTEGEDEESLVDLVRGTLRGMGAASR